MSVLNPLDTQCLDRRSAILTMATAVAAGCSGQVSIDTLSAPLNLQIDLDVTFQAGQPVAVLAERIGRDYGYQHPAENDPITLCQLLFGTDSPPATETMRNLIKSHVRQDFRNDDLVLLSGWYMTRSEGRLCLLAANYGLA